MRLSSLLLLCSNSGCSSPPLRLLFCHGLGSAKADAQLVQEWASKHERRLQFQMIKYTDYAQEQPAQPWTVNSWAKDIAKELDNRRQHIVNHDSMPQQQTVAVCVSAGAQAFLRAIYNSPSLLQNVAGLLLVSPGVGMEVNNYVERVLPGNAETLRAGLAVEHPTIDQHVRISIDLASLEDYEQHCILRRPMPAFDFPVRIVHGIYDKLVPFFNSVELLSKISTKDKALYLVNSGHLISEKSTLLHAVDSMWDSIQKREERRKELLNGIRHSEGQHSENQRKKICFLSKS